MMDEKLDELMRVKRAEGFREGILNKKFNDPEYESFGEYWKRLFREVYRNKITCIFSLGLGLGGLLIIIGFVFDAKIVKVIGFVLMNGLFLVVIFIFAYMLDRKKNIDVR